MSKLDYWKLHAYLFVESVLWTATDLVRARRMRLARRMKGAMEPPATAPDQPEAEI